MERFIQLVKVLEDFQKAQQEAQQKTQNGNEK